MWSSQIHFLRELLNQVETVIQSGLGRLTWQTFNIKSYCQKCDAVSIVFLLLSCAGGRNLYLIV